MKSIVTKLKKSGEEGSMMIQKVKGFFKKKKQQLKTQLIPQLQTESSQTTIVGNLMSVYPGITQQSDKKKLSDLVHRLKEQYQGSKQGGQGQQPKHGQQQGGQQRQQQQGQRQQGQGQGQQQRQQQQRQQQQGQQQQQGKKQQQQQQKHGQPPKQKQGQPQLQQQQKHGQPPKQQRGQRQQGQQQQQQGQQQQGKKQQQPQQQQGQLTFLDLKQGQQQQGKKQYFRIFNGRKGNLPVFEELRTMVPNKRLDVFKNLEEGKAVDKPRPPQDVLNLATLTQGGR